MVWGQVSFFAGYWVYDKFVNSLKKFVKLKEINCKAPEFSTDYEAESRKKRNFLPWFHSTITCLLEFVSSEGWCHISHHPSCSGSQTLSYRLSGWPTARGPALAWWQWGAFLEWQLFPGAAMGDHPGADMASPVDTAAAAHLAGLSACQESGWVVCCGLAEAVSIWKERQSLFSRVSGYQLVSKTQFLPPARVMYPY